MLEALRGSQLDPCYGFEELLEERPPDGFLEILKSLREEVEEGIFGLRRSSIRLRRLGHLGVSYTFSDQVSTLEMGNRAGTTES